MHANNPILQGAEGVYPSSTGRHVYVTRDGRTVCRPVDGDTWAQIVGAKRYVLRRRRVPKGAPRKEIAAAIARELGVAPTVAVLYDSSAPACGGWGSYRRVRVLRVYRGMTPPRIATTHSLAVHSVAWDSGRVYVGKTDSCAYTRAIDEGLRIVTEISGGAK